MGAQVMQHILQEMRQGFYAVTSRKDHFDQHLEQVDQRLELVGQRQSAS